MATFTKDIEEIRHRAMQRIEEGAVTPDYKLDIDRSIEILNEALATEIVCVLRYLHHYFMATGVHGRGVADLFKEHADEEREHADEIAERIQQLGGKPNFNPGELVQRSVSQYVEGENLADMIREDLIAERVVIEVYQRMIEYFGMKDTTTRTMIEHIKAEEEEHASELSDMMFIVNPHTGKDEGEDPGVDPLRLSSSIRNESSITRQKGTSPELREVEDEMEEEEEVAASPVRGNNRGAKATNSKTTNITNRSRDERVTPKAERGQGARSGAAKVVKKGTQSVGLRGESEAPASNIGGVSGRTMNRRRAEAIDVDEVAERPGRGGSSGGTRSPRVLQKNRKTKRAA